MARAHAPIPEAGVKNMPGFQDQSLGNWRIKRQVLEGEDIAYKFTPKYVLRAGQTVTVGAREFGAWVVPNTESQGGKRCVDSTCCETSPVATSCHV